MTVFEGGVYTRVLLSGQETSFPAGEGDVVAAAGAMGVLVWAASWLAAGEEGLAGSVLMSIVRSEGWVRIYV